VTPYTVVPLLNRPGSKVSSEAPKPPVKEEDHRAEAFEKEYKDTHPDGPYPPMEIKPKSEAKSA